MSGSPAQLKGKLGGAILTLQLSDSPDLSSMLRAVQNVTEVKKEDGIYSIRLGKTDAFPTIIETVTKNGFKISDINFTKPTLD